MKKCLFGLIFALILYGFLELLCACSLFILKKTRDLDDSRIRKTSLSPEHKKIMETLIDDPTTYKMFSPTLGWTMRKNGRSVSGGERTNSQGIRGDREYSLMPSNDVIRISCFGDSFTYCSAVKNPDTWQEYLTRSHPELETLNFGVGGYGLDQAFLRYQQDGVPFNPHVVFIGFMSENINRDVNVFRPFYMAGSRMPLTKPRFKVENDKLVLLENPIQEVSQYKEVIAHPEIMLPKFGANDFFYQTTREYGSLEFLPSVHLVRCLRNAASSSEEEIIGDGVYDENSEAFKVTVQIFNEFRDSAIRNHSVPIILLFPNRGDVVRHRKHQTKRYQPLIEDFRRKGYDYIDLLDAFDAYGRDLSMKELFKGHYTPRTNEFVAKYIAAYLRNNAAAKPLFARIEKAKTVEPTKN